MIEKRLRKSEVINDEALIPCENRVDRRIEQRKLGVLR